MANAKIVAAPYIFAETLYKANGAALAVGGVKSFRYHGSNETGKNQVKPKHLR